MRKIFLVIERRADYSRYKPILELLKPDPFFKIHLVVTGINLLKGHGNDIKKIEADGFTVNKTIPMFVDGAPDSGAEMVRAIGRFTQPIVDELEQAKPNLVLTGFDIGANFMTSVAAAHMNLPVAHIQGGEITGNIDESLRHAMSKFANWHFPATEKAKARLIKMGEDPGHIFVVGCPSLDLLVREPAVSRADLEKEINLDLSQPTVLVIQHPVTSEADQSLVQIGQTIDAVKELKIQALFILSNNDAGYLPIISQIKESGLNWLPSLEVDKISRLYRHIRAIVGNSSSGIHEAATFKVPCVNIGSRQQGRERAANVIDVDYDKNQIKAAIQKAVFDENFRASLKNLINPYGDGQTAPRIVKILKELPLDRLLTQKMFYE